MAGLFHAYRSGQLFIECLLSARAQEYPARHGSKRRRGDHKDVPLSHRQVFDAITALSTKLQLADFSNALGRLL